MKKPYIFQGDCPLQQGFRDVSIADQGHRAPSVDGQATAAEGDTHEAGGSLQHVEGVHGGRCEGKEA